MMLLVFVLLFACRVWFLMRMARSVPRGNTFILRFVQGQVLSKHLIVFNIRHTGRRASMMGDFEISGRLGRSPYSYVLHTGAPTAPHILFLRFPFPFTAFRAAAHPLKYKAQGLRFKGKA